MNKMTTTEKATFKRSQELQERVLAQGCGGSAVLEAENKRLRAKVERMRGVLEQFAEESSWELADNYDKDAGSLPMWAAGGVDPWLLALVALGGDA